jgi:N4-gp56 family major capsid protein
MADTIGPSMKQLWAKETWMSALQGLFFYKFFNKRSDDKNAAIFYTDELRREKGGQYNISLLTPLVGEGVEDDAVLEGNEEALIYYDVSLLLKEYAHAVRLKGRLAEQKVAVNMRKDAKAALSDWLQRKIDVTFVNVLSASPTTNRVLYGGDATSDATIDSSDVFSTTLISRAKRKAQLATIGTNNAESKIRPLRVNGAEHYLCLVHPYQAKALKTESAWQQAQREANIRGEKNPIFSGALGMWDGVVIHEYERIKTYSTWGAGGNLTGARALFLGAQAGALAVSRPPSWDEKTFDYNRKAGFAISTHAAIAKPKFNNEDYALIALDTYIAAD